MISRILIPLCLLLCGGVIGGSTAQAQVPMIYKLHEAMSLVPLTNAICLLKAKGGQTLRQYRPDKFGIISVELPADRQVEIHILCEGYVAKVFPFNTKELAALSNLEFDVELIRATWYTFKGTMTDAENNQFLTNTNVVMRNVVTNESYRTRTDDVGKFYFYVEPGFRYEVFADDSTHLKRVGIIDTDCADLAKNSWFCMRGFSFQGVEEDPQTHKQVLLASLNLQPAKLNYIYRMDNIYYEYNKAEVTPQGAKVLDGLYDLLLQNPSIKIELSSHTDSRGTAVYNRTLSQQRAVAAVDYLANKGIERRRMVPKGYGEDQLLNKCRDGVECSDDQHAQNRRTEFKVIAK